MMKALALVPLLTAACFDQPAYRPLADSPRDPIEFRALELRGQPTVIATGGTQRVTIADPMSVGWSGTASEGFAIEPYGDIWPNTQKPEYAVRALVPGAGLFEIATNHGIAAGTLASADVAGIALVPASYQLDGHSPFAIDPGRPLVQLAIYDGTARRLIDGSLDLAADGAMRASWDQLALRAAPAQQVVHVAADSFAPADLAVVLDGQVDHVVRTTEDGRPCYHAYHGATEIATMMPMLGERDPDAVNCAAAATTARQ